MKEVRRIQIDKVRSMCIRNDYYTNGTNAEYANMFEMCKGVAPTTEKYVEIAEDILNHSDKFGLMERYGMPEKGILECIVFELINDCTIVHIMDDDMEYQEFMY